MYLRDCSYLNIHDIADSYNNGDLNFVHDEIIKSLKIGRLYDEWLELWRKANLELNYFGYSESI